ncbi:APC family permease [Balamuthia mandrillaris]
MSSPPPTTTPSLSINGGGGLQASTGGGEGGGGAPTSRSASNERTPLLLSASSSLTASSYTSSPSMARFEQSWEFPGWGQVRRLDLDEAADEGGGESSSGSNSNRHSSRSSRRISASTSASSTSATPLLSSSPSDPSSSPSSASSDEGFSLRHSGSSDGGASSAPLPRVSSSSSSPRRATSPRRTSSLVSDTLWNPSSSSSSSSIGDKKSAKASAAGGGDKAVRYGGFANRYFSWLPGVKSEEQLAAMTEREREELHKLGQWRATSIAGNDILSSCLYVSGICTVAAGKFAPISLMLVAVVLYLFRSVYSEVGSALPCNGVLLNTTSKLVGAFAACLTLLSYVATAVVSASTAMAYAQAGIWPGMNLTVATICVLGLFALLNLLGLSESANVALLIFLAHVATLCLLVGWCFYRLGENEFSVWKENWKVPPMRNVPLDIFFGFCSALLGVTGFETSSNYIEEQREGVFPKTLRNMWFSVTLFNPLLGFLALGLIPIDDIVDHKEDLLAHLGQVVAGDWLNTLVSVDATLVLCGSVLTSYVGVGGLAKRMTLDRCLPQFLLAENPITHTNHFIIITFFLITSSLYLLVQGSIDALAGVYAIAFLSVMSLYAIGNILLKYKRERMPRDIRASWPAVILALAAVMAGLAGNIAYDPKNITYFSYYFGVTLMLVMIMFVRIRLLKIVYYFLSKTFLKKYIGDWIQKQIKNINQQSVVFFAKTDELHILNKAVLYVRDNELTSSLLFVHIYDLEEDIPQDLAAHVALLDRIYPKIRMDLVCCL